MNSRSAPKRIIALTMPTRTGSHRLKRVIAIHVNSAVFQKVRQNPFRGVKSKVLMENPSCRIRRKHLRTNPIVIPFRAERNSMPDLTLGPPPRKATTQVYYSMTKSLCGSCKTAVDAKIVIRDDAVYFDKFCPEHGHEQCLVSSSAEWYLDCLTFLAPHRPPKRVMKEVEQGCPFDCGACPQHQQKVYLPVVPITSACNLDCPICYTINKNEHAHMLSTEDFQKILQHLAEDHDELDIINFTGGEPTLHPQL